MSAGACVFLIHLAQPGPRGRRHFLAVDLERADPALPREVRYGSGAVPVPTGAAIVDVWECRSVAAANELYKSLARQGGRARLCSVCSPGNLRGGGKGKYIRVKGGSR